MAHLMMKVVFFFSILCEIVFSMLPIVFEIKLCNILTKKLVLNFLIRQYYVSRGCLNFSNKTQVGGGTSLAGIDFVEMKYCTRLMNSKVILLIIYITYITDNQYFNSIYIIFPFVPTPKNH